MDQPWVYLLEAGSSTKSKRIWMIWFQLLFEMKLIRDMKLHQRQESRLICHDWHKMLLTSMTSWHERMKTIHHIESSLEHWYKINMVLTSHQELVHLHYLVTHQTDHLMVWNLKVRNLIWRLFQIHSRLKLVMVETKQ